MIFRKVRIEEKDKVFALYQSVINKGFCVWDDEYPGMDNIEEDISNDNLYALVDNNDFVGAISINCVNEMDGYNEWKNTNALEIARVCIIPVKQHLGLSEALIKEIIPIIKSRNKDSIHLSVHNANIPALKTYKKTGFINLGLKEMYEDKYYIMEKII